jgi:hypothetical protein
MPGGRDAFEEAGKRKVQQYEMMMKYGEEFAQKFATTRDAMEKLLQRSGYGREAITQIIENQTALSQMTDVDVAGWAADVNSKYSSLGLTVEKSTVWARDLAKAWVANSLAGDTFQESLNGIMDTFSELQSQMGTDKAMQTAVNLSSLGRGNHWGTRQIAGLSHTLAQMGTGNLESGLYATVEHYMAPEMKGRGYQAYVKDLHQMGGLDQLAAAQRMAKLIPTKGADITEDLKIKKIIPALFGDIETWRLLHDSIDITTDKIKEADVSVQSLDGSLAKLSLKEFLGKEDTERLEKASTLFSTIKGFIGSFETHVAKDTPKDLSYILSLAIPLTLLANKSTRLFGALAMAQGNKGGGNGEAAGADLVSNVMGPLSQIMVINSLKEGMARGGKAAGKNMQLELFESTASKEAAGGMGKLMGLAFEGAVILEAFSIGWAIGKGIAGMLKDLEDKDRKEHPEKYGTAGEFMYGPSKPLSPARQDSLANYGGTRKAGLKDASYWGAALTSFMTGVDLPGPLVHAAPEGGNPMQDEEDLWESLPTDRQNAYKKNLAEVINVNVNFDSTGTIKAAVESSSKRAIKVNTSRGHYEDGSGY